MVDPDDALIAQVIASAAPDLIQLHGHETPTRVAEIRSRWGIPVMKAVPVETADDARAARQFPPAADLILFDARAPADSTRPGGNGAPFDWRTLLGVKERGSVHALGRAHSRQRRRGHPPTGAAIVDVSSGVESRPGEKDPDLIRRFLRAAKGV